MKLNTKLTVLILTASAFSCSVLAKTDTLLKVQKDWAACQYQTKR